MEKKVIGKYLISSLIFATTLLSSAQAGEIEPVQVPGFSTVVTWKSEKNVSYCAKADSVQMVCKSGVMPEWIGHVDKILQGNFTSKTQPNWLVFADQKIALCSITKSAKATCVKVMEDPDVANYDFAFRDGTFYVSPSERARRSSLERTEEFSSRIAHALRWAIPKMAKRVAGNSPNAIQPSPALKAALPSSRMLAKEGTGSDDEDMPPDPNGSGGGGGSNDSAGWGGDTGPSVIVPCIQPFCAIVIVPPPPLPIDPDYIQPPTTQPSEPGWLCKYVSNIFCSADDDAWKEAEEKRCRAEKANCIAECTSTLPTNTPNGDPFYSCVSRCMERVGCSL